MPKSKQPASKKKTSLEAIPKGYRAFLDDLKTRIRSAQVKAALKVNAELIQLYWRIGIDLSKRECEEGWGAKVIERLAQDLKSSFPGMKGFSQRNLLYMRQFADAYPDFEITQQIVAQIPWGHNILLMEKIEDMTTRLWYIQKTIENGWSRNVLWHWIDARLFERKGKAITNFKHTLPAPQSDLAQQSLKDPYCLDFLTLRENHDEKELEQGLIDHIQKLLIELGKGFAFVGRQYPLKAGKKDIYIDLLFYHLKLRCYVVVELKAGEFDSRDAGQMSIYLSAVDDHLKHENDELTIGIILCKLKDNVFVEYALRNFKRPIGVAQFALDMVEKLPKELKSSLPTIEEIEAELEERT